MIGSHVVERVAGHRADGDSIDQNVSNMITHAGRDGEGLIRPVIDCLDSCGCDRAVGPCTRCDRILYDLEVCYQRPVASDREAITCIGRYRSAALRPVGKCISGIGCCGYGYGGARIECTASTRRSACNRC